MALVVVAAPAVEPVTVGEFKIHARIDFDDENATIEKKLVAARQYVERFIGRPLISTTYRWLFDCFPAGTLTLPKAPVQSVTSIKYLAADTEIETTLSGASYTVDVASDPGRIAPSDSGWPSTQSIMNAVRIEFVAGYGAAADDVPYPLREAVLKLGAQLYEHREAALIDSSVAAMPYGVGDVLSEYREWSF